jgi:hypothetical protein
MNRQSQWLFEAPPALNATYPNNYSASPEYYSPELESDPLFARRRVPNPPFFPPRSKRNPLDSKFSRARAFIAKRATTRIPREIAQEYADQPRRYFYWDVWWLNPSSGKYEALEARGPLYTIRDDGEKIRSTLLLKWQAQRGGGILARCFVWNGEKWFFCKDYSF